MSFVLDKHFEKECIDFIHIRERVMRKIVKDGEIKFDQILSEDRAVDIKLELQNIIREGIKTYSEVMGRPITKNEIYMMFS